MSSTIDFDRFDALVFDCDGTLALNAHVHCSALMEAFSTAGHALPEAFYMPRTGMSLAHLLDAYAEETGVQLQVDDVLPAAVAAYHRDVGLIRDAARVTGVVRAYAGRKPLAVASSAWRTLVDATLAELGIADLFDAIVTVEDIQHAKPAPDSYLLAAHRLGVDPARCLAFEDSDQGLAAAKAAGMETIDVRLDGWRD